MCVAGIAIVAFILMFFVGPHIATVFIRPDDIKLRNMSYIAIKIFAFSYLVGWIDMCFSAFFTALDKVLHSLVISIFGTLIFPVIFLCILTKIYGINGVWLMTSVAACASGALTLFLVKKMKKYN